MILRMQPVLRPFTSSHWIFGRVSVLNQAEKSGHRLVFMSKIVKRILIGVILSVVVLGLAWRKLDRADAGAAPAGPARVASALSATGYVASTATLTERVLTTGTLRANEEVNLASESSGKVTGIYFNEGSRVTKGQLLVKINDSELVAQRQRIEYRLRLAEEQLARQQVLLEKGGVSREEYERFENEVNVLRAELQLNEAQIAKTEVRAPFDGVLGLRHVSEGSYISPQDRIATLQDVSPIKIDFSVPEKYATLVRVGTTVNFTVSGNPQVFRGTVYAIEPRIDENTRTLQVRAESPNPDGSLLPGAFAEIQLVVSEHDEAIVVPAISIIPELEGKKVFVVENGRVAQRMVETGIRTDSMVQVLSGLSLQDTVLTSGLQLARPGMPVDVIVP